MNIRAYPFKAKGTVIKGQRIQGTISYPQGSRVIHVGATPPKGELFVYCEVGSMETPYVSVDVTVLMVGDNVPEGYEYLGYILAQPILFVYEKKTTILSV